MKERLDKRYKKTIFFLLVFCLSFSFFQCAQAEGGIEINDCSDLQSIGNDPAFPLDGEYVLKKDIDCKETEEWNYDGENYLGFEPIGSAENPFTGKLKGEGNKIKGIYINRPSMDNVGIFQKVENGEISKVGLKDFLVNGNDCVGTFAGIIDEGIIRESYATGEVSGNFLVGGLVGENNRGEIRNSYFIGNISGEKIIGGFVGNSWGSDAKIKNSYAVGEVLGSEDVGGLVGENNRGEIRNSYSTSSVVGIDSVGGFVGKDEEGEIKNCFFMKGVVIRFVLEKGRAMITVIWLM